MKKLIPLLVKKDYNYENDVKKYFNKWNIGDISCETLAENSDNSEKYFSNKFEKDFQTDYLKGNNVPSFMKNYLSNKPFLTTPIMKKIYDCGKYFHDQEKEGKITTEEMEEFLEKINSIDANEVVKALELKKAEMMTDDFDPDEYNKEQSCGTIFGDVKESGSFAWLIQKILNYIKIIGPTLVIILSSIDFIKVIWLSDEESMKKAQIKLAKRIVAAILLFLLPSLIGVLFNLINDSIEDPTCKIG